MDFQFIIKSFPSIVKAVPITLLMAFSATILGWALGLVIALVRRAKTPIISQILAIYVSFMRSVPAVILLYISYFVMPNVIQSYMRSIGKEIDISLVPAVLYAIGALTMIQSAYSSEVFRSAIASIDEGQMEACYSVGMTKFQALIRIIFPQAFATAMPNLGGLFIGLIKDTSLAYYVGVYEITATAQLLSLPKLNFIEAYIMTTIVYEILSFIFNKLFRAEENHLKKFRAAATS